MAEYFQIPEVGTKVRPGSYFNVDKNGDDDSFGAIAVSYTHLDVYKRQGS